MCSYFGFHFLTIYFLFSLLVWKKEQILKQNRIIFFCLTYNFLYFCSHFFIFHYSNQNKIAAAIKIQEENCGGLTCWFLLQWKSGKILIKGSQHKGDPFCVLVLEINMMTCPKVPLLSCIKNVLIILFIYNTPQCIWGLLIPAELPSATGDCFRDGKKWDVKADVSSRRSCQREAKERIPEEQKCKLLEQQQQKIPLFDIY